MTNKISYFGRKFLSLVLALVMTVSIMNLAPLANEAKAATPIYFRSNVDGIADSGAKIFVVEGDGAMYDGEQKVAGTEMHYDGFIDNMHQWSASVSTTKIRFSRAGWDGGKNANVFWGWIWDNIPDRGNNTVFTATNGGNGGSWSVPESTEEKFTFVFDGNSDVETASASIKIYVGDTEYATASLGNHKYSAEIPENTATVTVKRIAPDGGTWNYWNVDVSSRGTSTEYKSTGWGTPGTGEWVGGSAPAGQANLIVTNITWDGTPTTDSELTFTATIKNVGTADVPNGKKIGMIFEVDGLGTYTWGAIYNGLSVNEEKTITANGGSNDTGKYVKLSAGSHEVWATVNNDHETNSEAATESNYDDNRYNKTITVTQAGGGSSTPSAPHSGTPLTGPTYSVSAFDFPEQKDLNNDDVELYIANAIIYDYFNDTQIKAAINGGNDYDITKTPFKYEDRYDTEIDDGNGAWKVQFQLFNNAIIRDYQFSNPVRDSHPLLVSGIDTKDNWSAWKSEPPLAYIYSRAKMAGMYTGDDYAPSELDYRINHGIQDHGHASVQGIVKNYLSTDGDILLPSNTLLPYFDAEYLTSNHLGAVYGDKESPVGFPFRKAGDYYVFDSGSGRDNAKLVVDDSAASGYSMEYNSAESAQVKDTEGSGNVGYFPLNNGGDSAKNDRYSINYGIGTRIDIPFTVPQKTASSYNIASGVLNGGEGTWLKNESDIDFWTSPSYNFNLNSIGTGEKYLIVKGSGAGINLDFVKVGSTYYPTESCVASNNISYYNNGSDEVICKFDNGAVTSKILNFGADGYAVYKINANNESQVTLGYREYTSTGYNMSVAVVDSLSDVANAIADMGSNDDIVFNFTGDDDLWIYIDGVLALDMGGAHGKSVGNINFTSGWATAEDAINIDGNNGFGEKKVKLSDLGLNFNDASVEHTMSVFYMERGLYESNLMVSFNFVPVVQQTGLVVKNIVDISAVNPGFGLNINPNDYAFFYDVYDATVNKASNAAGHGDDKSTFYVDPVQGGGRIYLRGSGSKTASVKRDITKGETPILGDQIKITQDQNMLFNGATVYTGDLVNIANLFDTSWILKDITNGETVIKECDNNSPDGTKHGDPFNVRDDINDDSYWDNGVEYPMDNTVTLQEANHQAGDEYPNNLTLMAQFTNKVKTSTITISVEDTSIAHDEENDTYVYNVTYTKLLGVNKTGFYAGAYTVLDTRNNTTREATTNANGDIVLHSYEKAIITGVPVSSDIKIAQKEDGNLKKVTVDTAGAATTEVANGGVYSLTGEVNKTYDWTFVNADANTETYFAEVGTPIVINNGDELTLAPNGTNKSESFTYIKPADPISYDIKPSETPVTGGFDLIVTDISWKVGDGEIGHGDINVGDEVTFYATVKNIGDTQSSTTRENGILGLGFAIDGNYQRWNDDQIPHIDAGASVQLEIKGGTDAGKWTATNGSHNFEAFVDDQNKAVETNDENNKYKISLTTPYSDTKEGVAEKTIKYHEVISDAKPVSGTTIGTVTKNDSSITYTYPSNAEAGTDVFYYQTSKVAEEDIYVNDEKVVSNGQQFDTKTIPVVVTAYKANNDVYVVDYGLPVNLSAEPNAIYANDNLVFGDGTEFKGVGLAASQPAKGNYDATGYSASIEKAYGNVTFASDVYKYTPNKIIAAADEFYYGVQVKSTGLASTAKLNASNATPSMSSKVTIVPASVVYYEDNFDYAASNTHTAISYSGTVVVNGTPLDVKVQSNSLEGNYGNDAVYNGQNTSSFGETELGHNAVVTFEFTGTGFDIIARAGNTPAVLYAVINKSTNKVAAYGQVDTYYSRDTVYQLPVISVTDLPRDDYEVRFVVQKTALSCEYEMEEDGVTYKYLKDEDGEYILNEYGNKIRIIKPGTETYNETFYFDGIRIYNPLTDAEAEQYYLSNEFGAKTYSIKDLATGKVKDGEGNVSAPAISETTIYNVKTTPISKTNWTITASDWNSNAGRLKDGIVEGGNDYRWSTGKFMTPGMWLEFDLGKVESFDRITFIQDTSKSDYMRGYEFYVSNEVDDEGNPVYGSPVLVGTTPDGKAAAEFSYDLWNQNARYIKVVQTGSSDVNYWSITEVEISKVSVGEAPKTDSEGNPILNVNVPNAQLSIVGNMIYENLGGNVTSGTSFNDIMTSGPNNEIYLDQNSAIKFNVAKDPAVSDADRTLQIEAKGIGDSAVLNLNGSSASVNTRTAMYYNVPVTFAAGSNTAEVTITTNKKLSVTNLKVKGYTLTAIAPATPAVEGIKATSISSKANEVAPVTFTSRTESVVYVTFSGTIDPNRVSVYANGTTIPIRKIEAVAGQTNVYKITTLAPAAVGSFKYSFQYLDSSAATRYSENIKVVAATRGGRS